MKHTRSLFILLFSLFCTVCFGETISVKVTPDHQDWTYALGEQACFHVSISGDIIEEYTISYDIGLEKMPPVKSAAFKSSKSSLTIEAGTVDAPGFLRCTVTVIHAGETYSGVATAAFEPEKIKPTTKCPRDFDRFWKEAISEARKIPLETELILLNDRCTDAYNVYQVSYLNHEYKNRSYGILTVPAKTGKFPAVLRFPGAGVHPLGGNTAIADQDVITLDLYIHPFPMTWESGFYDGLKASPYIEYKFWGVENRDAYYFKRVIIGCVKAVDVIFSLPEFDGENLAAWGSSQGGALSIITTSLDKRIKRFVALCPAMCDYTGYLHGRAGGWPHFFDQANIEMYNHESVLKTLSYFDVVNFARNISVPGFFSWGFNDPTTPPTSFYSAYNVIKAPKQTYIIPEGVHKIYPEQVERTYQWIFNFFGR
ncbi:MAG: acetylxylan esterase [Fermentimonas sp.]|jgi:cephalosporin-C deacetylase